MLVTHKISVSSKNLRTVDKHRPNQIYHSNRKKTKESQNGRNTSLDVKRTFYCIVPFSMHCPDVTDKFAKTFKLIRNCRCLPNNFPVQDTKDCVYCSDTSAAIFSDPSDTDFDAFDMAQVVLLGYRAQVGLALIFDPEISVVTPTFASVIEMCSYPNFCPSIFSTYPTFPR